MFGGNDKKQYICGVKGIEPAIRTITTSPGFNTDAEISESQNNSEVYNLLMFN